MFIHLQSGKLLIKSVNASFAILFKSESDEYLEISVVKYTYIAFSFKYDLLKGKHLLPNLFLLEFFFA